MKQGQFIRNYEIPLNILEIKKKFNLLPINDLIDKLNEKIDSKYVQIALLEAIVDNLIEKVGKEQMNFISMFLEISELYSRINLPSISNAIKSMLRMEYSQKEEISLKSQFFTEKQLKVFSKIAVTEKYKKGEYIIRKGTIGIDMYFIVSGEVTVLLEKLNTGIKDVDLSVGNIIGEMVHCGKARSRTADVIAKTEAELIRFNIKELYNLEKLSIANKGDIIEIEDLISKLANKRFQENQKFLLRLQELREILKNKNLTREERILVSHKIIELEERIMKLKKK